MAPTARVMTFRPDSDILEAMEAYRDRDGVPFSVQIRRALRPWLESKGVLAKKEHGSPVAIRKRAEIGQKRRRS